MNTPSAPSGWRYHPDRDALLAEAHARPYVLVAPLMIATRIATLSGEKGAATDRAHMTKLCRMLGHVEPTEGAAWHALEAGQWRLRWERHTELSTWTFFREPLGNMPFAETALDLAPADWVNALPGEVIVATTLELRTPDQAGDPMRLFASDVAGAEIEDGLMTVYSDFRTDARRMTRWLLIDRSGDPGHCGRQVRSILEIETYRLMALLAFPVARATGGEVSRIEQEAGELASQLAGAHEPERDRALLGRLVALAGRAEGLNAQTTYRFSAARAYHEIVRDRIRDLRETPVKGLQTLGDFMERRLAPAMRTCDSITDRKRRVIERIARTERMLNTRVEIAAEGASFALLASMDRRAKMQLMLQRTVEGLSVAAISYYAIGLLSYAFAALSHLWPALDPKFLTGLSVPVVVAAVWVVISRRKAILGLDREDEG
jgi:uncharacterized membrane-anchored protein